ncbi:acyl-CoA dehydrogenase family protein [Stenotrophobium rhamnosiphilum]|uniref:Acyl-CoA dehydrogenase n=1 Tax=Stenotrophobium rhamnosiphilum TaxID=2029166 RepID=A0A2T5MC63_9GAMM|nr:acyl-CoA dehydrogenase [Stenotrophobium rhamnosiphilum]PTU30168.1 acyl-CoA dehydrogenase [Stenotrophobium rhamnosiphilum]
MNFELSEEQQMMRESFARFLDQESSTVRVRAAMPSGFDKQMWNGLAELGAFSVRVPEEAGGLGLGLLDAALLMEEAGRTLASGPVAETLVAARLLALLGGQAELLERVTTGAAVVSLAFHDIAQQPRQWVAGGAVAEAVIARDGKNILLLSVPESARGGEDNLASTPVAELALKEFPRTVLSSNGEGHIIFSQALEEWKLLIGAALAGLGRESLRLAAAYASERKQFGQFIGQFQAISHPLADLVCEVDGGKFLVWKAIRHIADGAPEAGAAVSIAAWWNSEAASRAVAQALHTFGGYGLTTEYDIFLFNLRAKAWPLVFGDPQRLLQEAGRRLYGGERAVLVLPDAGDCPVDFDLGDDARSITKEINAFFEKNVTPEMREKFHYSWEGYNPEIHQKLAEADLLFPGLPKDMGGRGLKTYAKIAAMDAFEHQGYNTPAANVAQMVSLIIYRFGTDELKREVLTKLMKGEAIASLGYSEPGSGSDVFAAQCKATQEPDGSWRIDGTKMFTSGANLASYVLMLCRTNTEVAKHAGLTMFIVPLKAQGVTVQPVHTFQDERTNITFYDGVRIPDSWRLGPVDAGVKTMAASLELEHGGGFSKVQRAMLKAAEQMCREISFEGRPLIEDRTAQSRLARSTANLWVSDMLTFRAQWTIAEKKQNLGYGPMAKMFSSEKFLTDSRDLLDLTAPYSLSKRAGPAGFLNQCYRHAQGTTIYGGTSEVHRSMIAERGLGMPRTRA